MSHDGDVGPAPEALVCGWKLPNDTIVCRACCPKPADAVAVTLVCEGDDLHWEESDADPVAVPPVNSELPVDRKAEVNAAAAIDVQSDDNDHLFPEGF
ncbi:hypothetical protein [Alienimonas chondri]|nr:hypothetical protein [Alienimonas chondri]